MDDILENISNQIRDLRVLKKITQQELAERTNLSVPYISQIENNHRNISLETFVKIIDALEISLSDFFLPYSVAQDKEMMELLLKIQKHPQHKMIVHKMMEILELSQDS
jgi:helix-turn-helix family protein